MPQKFVAVINDTRTESTRPSWELVILKPTRVLLYAVNGKGSSDPYIMNDIFLKGVAKFTGMERTIVLAEIKICSLTFFKPMESSEIR